MAKIIRTRFAPSPTGFMHIGNLRTALFEYLVAKNKKGKFILRIEDTDRERYVDGAVDLIYNTLKQVGLKHDEGPDIGGKYGPYVQSERKNTYLPVALELIKKGHAYYCFCSEERLKNLKQENSHTAYDGHCRDLDEETVRKNLEANIPYVIRQKMPKKGKTTFKDEVYGEISVDNCELEDQILIKQDGFPTYNFANVVDDHDMNITHVVRGCEYLSSTPKYNLLYDALGYEKPVYIHLPHILGQDGQKLSKRHGSTSFADLIAEGYLPEAIVNYIALLGWSPSDNKEIFSLSELEESFDISGISKSPAIFDYEKLAWFNSQYIQNMDEDKFFNTIKDQLEKYLQNINLNIQQLKLLSSLLKKRLKKINDFKDSIKFLIKYEKPDSELFVHQKMKTDKNLSLTVLKDFIHILNHCHTWESEVLHELMLKYATENQLKNGQVMWPIRIAITAQAVTPGGAVEALVLLGKEESLKRLELAINSLQNN